jgi:hypothetical protein
VSGSFNPQASYVPAGLRKAAKEALQQGWTAKKSGREGWFIRSPKGTQKFYLPITAKDPDALARKLRSLINKAYLAESGGLGPKFSDVPGAVDRLTFMQDKVMESTGGVIRQGPDPTLTCPDCDGEWVEIEGLMAHQEACQERVRAALAAEQAEEVPEEGGVVAEPSEGRTETVPEQEQSGTIAHQEETLNTEQAPAPKRTRRSWTLTTNNPLHRALYVAIRSVPRRAHETDSKWALRLTEYFMEENLLDEVLPEFEPVDEVSAGRMLAQIRALVGSDEADELKAKVAELTESNERLRNAFTTLSELAQEATK